MLNFGHLRQTSPSESCRAQASHPPVSSGQAKRLARRRGQPNALPRSTPALSFLFPGTFPAYSAPLCGPRCPRRSAGHSGRGYCPEIRSTLCQTIAFRFYHNFRKNTNPNPGGSLTAAFFHGLLTQDLRNSNQWDSSSWILPVKEGNYLKIVRMLLCPVSLL